MYNIYTYLFINFAKRLGSLTEQAPLRVPEKKRKLVIQLNRMTILKKRQKKEMQMQKQNWEGHR